MCRLYQVPGIIYCSSSTAERASQYTVLDKQRDVHEESYRRIDVRCQGFDGMSVTVWVEL